jgi:multidrug efflux pump subunit AcrA (membrane-fusion protein)
LQDKVFVYLLADSNKVIGKPLTIAGRSGNVYLVSAGLKAGDEIVLQGIDRLHDGQVIKPKLVKPDSAVRTAKL